MLFRLVAPHLPALLALTLASGHCGTPPGGSDTPVPGVPWTDITPAGVDLAADGFGGDNFGMQVILVDPVDPATLLLSVCHQGLWRSADRGATWTKVSTGAGGDALDQGCAWSLAQDPTAPAVLYATSGHGALGLWRSADGGSTWTQLFTSDAAQNPTGPVNWTGGLMPDLLDVKIDPADARHLLATFHDNPWTGREASGLVESTDAGATWRLVDPPDGFGVGHCVFFLPGGGWLVMANTAAAGSWLSQDGGATFTRLNDFGAAGGCQLYQAGDGALYAGELGGVIRSADGGLTWTRVYGRGPVMGVAGDGTRIFASVAQPQLTLPLYVPTLVAEEAAGDSSWSPYGDQQFINGARTLAVDAAGHHVYAAAWRQGALRLDGY